MTLLKAAQPSIEQGYQYRALGNSDFVSGWSMILRLDFARAVASLGVDRGITEFQRYGFHVRNGLAYFATPLQRLLVRHDTVISDLLAPCDGWIDRFLSKAKADTVPGSIRRAANRLETAIFAQAAAANSSPQNNFTTIQELLIALGESERALAKSEKWRTEAFIAPVPPLPREWVKSASDDSSEFRLAAALASAGTWFKKEFFPIRRHLEAVKVISGDKPWAIWDAEAKNDVAWHEGEITDVLCAMMTRRLLLAKKAGMESWPDFAKLTAWPSEDALAATSIEELLGIEGAAASQYFQQFSGMVKVEDDDLPGLEMERKDDKQLAFNFNFSNRNRRPPTDPVNAMLSLAYSMLAKDCTLATLAVGFDPYLGFYHQPRFGRPALGLDLMEEFRPLIAESTVLNCINNRIVTEKDFVRAGQAVNLSAPGRKRFFQTYEQRMCSLITHPLFDYKVSYRRALELQARLLAKTLTGEIAEYIPLMTR